MFAITLIFVYSRQENSRGYAELKIAKLADKKFMTFAGADGTGHLSAVPPGPSSRRHLAGIIPFQ